MFISWTVVGTEKTLKTREKKGDWVRRASRIDAVNCPFRLRITWEEGRKVWQLVTCNLEHSHAMCSDPFVFIQHRERDPDRSAAEASALVMWTSHTKYGQAKRTLREHGLSIKRKDHNNLQRTVEKITPETELYRVVAALEHKGFHVRFNEKYLVEGNEKSRRVVDLRLENKIGEILDDDIWDAGYDTDSLTFLLPSQRMSRDNIIN